VLEAQRPQLGRNGIALSQERDSSLPGEERLSNSFADGCHEISPIFEEVFDEMPQRNELGLFSVESLALEAPEREKSGKEGDDCEVTYYEMSDVIAMLSGFW